MQSRFDIYGIVHKGLRAGLAQVLVLIGRTDWDDRAQSQSALAAIRELLDLFRVHIQIEDQCIHPAMEAAQPRSTLRTSTEHRGHEQEIAGIEAAARSLTDCPDGERTVAAAVLYRRWALFVAENLEHMDDEEMRNNDLLWASYDDATLQQLQQAGICALPENLKTRLHSLIVASTTTGECASLGLAATQAEVIA